MRRSSIAIAVVLVLLAMSSAALAKPKVVVAPLRGDAKDKVGEVLREGLAEKVEVIPAAEVEKAIDKLGIKGELSEQEVEKLRTRLGAAVVVHGRVGKAGKKKSLKLVVSVRGKQPDDFSVQYKSVTQEGFRDRVAGALVKKMGPLDELEDEEKPKKRLASREGGEGEGDGDGDKPKKKKRGDGDGEGDKPKKKVASREGGAGEGDGDGDKPRKKKRGDGDSDGDRPKQKVAAADDDGEPRARKKRRDREGGDGEGVKERAPAAVAAAARIDAGLSIGVRRLSYTVGPTSTQPPPRVATGAGGARFEAEVYPLALSNGKGPLAGLGFVGDYDRAIGLSIDLPAIGAKVPINQTAYSVGARYRIASASRAVAFGVRYARRQYIADRSGLNSPMQLDTPDVNYSSIAPEIAGRVRLAPRIALFADVAGMLVLDTGGIQSTEYFGAASVYGFGVGAGVDVSLGKQFGLRIGGDFSQMSLSFKGTGAMASARDVSAAVDRNFGAAATLAAMF